MIDFHTYSQIQDLYHRQNQSIAEISRKLSLDPRTVSVWVKKKRYSQRKKSSRSSILDPYKSEIQKEIELAPCTATSIYNQLKTQGYDGSYTTVKKYLAGSKIPYSNNAETILPCRWMLSVIQGKISVQSLINEYDLDLSLKDAEKLIDYILEGRLRERNRAIVIIAFLKDIPISKIAQFVMLDSRTIKRILGKYNRHGISGSFSFRENIRKKHEQSEYKDTLFSILHAPPSCYNINRTSWTMQDLHCVMRDKGLPINKNSIRKIIKSAGYRFRKAKKVLTSTDPNYQEKLKSITKILSNLSQSESFFSIDEYGPFAIKMQGGVSLTDSRNPRFVPQWQKSKGSLILTGALELSTNQVTHFYSDKKNTSEMIILLYKLISKYKKQDRIFFSWDAASWHASKELEKEVRQINSDDYRKKKQYPFSCISTTSSLRTVS